jgi:hypothetical protein
MIWITGLQPEQIFKSRTATGIDVSSKIYHLLEGDHERCQYRKRMCQIFSPVVWDGGDGVILPALRDRYVRTGTHFTKNPVWKIVASTSCGSCSVIQIRHDWPKRVTNYLVRCNNTSTTRFFRHTHHQPPATTPLLVDVVAAHEAVVELRSTHPSNGHIAKNVSTVVRLLVPLIDDVLVFFVDPPNSSATTCCRGVLRECFG